MKINIQKESNHFSWDDGHIQEKLLRFAVIIDSQEAAPKGAGTFRAPSTQALPLSTPLLPLVLAVEPGPPAGKHMLYNGSTLPASDVCIFSNCNAMSKTGK